MESAPTPRRDWRSRFNEIADEGALLYYLLFTIALFGPLVAGWFVVGWPDDWAGWLVVIVYPFIARKIWLGLVRGDWY